MNRGKGPWIGLMLVAAGCATTSGALPVLPGGDGRSVDRIGLEVAEPVTVESPLPEFPRLATTPRLPSADRLRHSLQAEGGGMAAAQVKLCVVPSGAVAQVVLQRSSGMPHYDQAVLDDVRRWHYQSFPAPATIQVCQLLTVAYLAR